jgi:hypothetical protein
MAILGLSFFGGGGGNLFGGNKQQQTAPIAPSVYSGAPQIPLSGDSAFGSYSWGNWGNSNNTIKRPGE